MKKNILFYSLVFALIIFQFILFNHYVHAAIVDFYPTNFDQQSYLTTCYALYESIKHAGIWHGFLNGPVLSTGFLFPIQTVLFFLLVGASRFHALLINFIYFAAMQIFIVSVCKKLLNNFSIPLILLGFLLVVNVPFLVPGGLADFRMDFIAFCLYGIVITCILRSDIFLNKRWAILAAFLTVLLVLTRTITAVYFTGIIFFIFLYLFISYFYYTKDAFQKMQSFIRIKNLTWYTSIIAIMSIPVMWLNRIALYNYYVVGHITGKEKYIRAALSGTTSTWASLTYYPRTLCNYNFSFRAIICYAVLFLAIFVLRFIQKQNSDSHRLSNNPIHKPITFYFLLVSILFPMIALTADMQKSFLVASVLITPILWILILIFSRMSEKLSASVKQRALPILATVIVLFACVYQIHAYCSRSKLSPERKYALNQLTKMYLQVGDYAVAHHWSQVKLSVDQVDDRLTNGDLIVIYYEKRKILLNVGTNLGGSIFAVDKKQALQELNASNVVIFDLNHNPGNIGFPLNASVDKLKPILIPYLYSHFHLLKKYRIGKQIFGVFVK
ncbi:MAG TPA: hypothetical protein VJK30_01080 [Coxiellaceae bacterium]|nr:MAG: hypothetical protein A3E81_04860 [Gammaproteobacteria bacterium RIFCSPHIGHO2_12_FULL_36_30]HLB55912.1 hypothetical protein [Coxiellaceae bacterium]